MQSDEALDSNHPIAALPLSPRQDQQQLVGVLQRREFYPRVNALLSYRHPVGVLPPNLTHPVIRIIVLSRLVPG